MNESEMRIAIATKCGWIKAYEEGEDEGTGNWFWHRGNQNLRQPPNYPADLNAMHEAEKVLNEKQQVWYLQKLTQVRFKDGVSGMIACMIDKTTFATAPQRATAFCRVFWPERFEKL